MSKEATQGHVVLRAVVPINVWEKFNAVVEEHLQSAYECGGYDQYGPAKPDEIADWILNPGTDELRTAADVASEHAIVKQFLVALVIARRVEYSTANRCDGVITSEKACPFCDAPATVGYCDDHGYFLNCPNLHCPLNKTSKDGGAGDDWSIAKPEDETKVHRILFPLESEPRKPRSNNPHCFRQWKGRMAHA